MLSHTNIPGLRIVFSSHHPVRRLAWLIAVVTLGCFLFRDLRQVISDYRRFDDVMSLDVLFDDDGVALPCITVCNMNGVRRSAFCGSDGSNVSSTKYRMWQEKLCGQEGARQKNWLTSRSRGDDLLAFSHWIGQVLERNDSHGRFLGHQMKDTILECRVGITRDCNSEKYFTTKQYGRFGNCFCFGCNRENSSDYGMRHITYSELGVQLLLNLELEEYLPVSTDAGFMIGIHEHGVEVDFTYDGVFVPPRHTTYIAVQRWTMERQKPPYVQPCQEDWPEEYEAYVDEGNRYTSEECKDLCIQVGTWEACGCQTANHHVVRRPNVPGDICNDDVVDVDGCANVVESKVQSGEHRCPCLQSCLERRYTTEATFIPWTKYLDQHGRVLEGGGEDGDEVLAKVCVYFATDNVEQRRKMPKMTTASLVSTVAGIMGMYLGISFLMFFNILDVATREALRAYRKRVARKNAAA